MKTGEKIRQARERLIIGQAELARAAELDHSGYWHIEHGNRIPRPATLRKLAAAMATLSGEPISPADLRGDDYPTGR